ncbi:uncharacterized protein LOC141656238 [Silene latifolia]|uniref:uncharacterized protein LOC141656238 n=1 Tax=Silene latifolia TaxID=37657 RepID=UPI003D775083
MFPDTSIKHFPIQISDHAPIEVDLNLTKNSTKKPYRLDSWALEYSECLECVKETWCIQDIGSPTFRVVRRLLRVRQCVKKWALDKRGEWSGKWDEFDKRLEQGMKVAIKGGSDVEYSRVNDEVRNFAKAVVTYWKQRAKIKWMVDGDTCTKNFFDWVKGRAGRNFILGVKGRDGTWYFMADKDPFMSSSNAYENTYDDVLNHLSTKVLADDVDLLGMPFTAKEVRRAVFQMRSVKLLGPDGISAIFYQKCWHVIKKDFTKAVLSILNSGMVLREIVTKCITNRLVKIMGYLLGDHQNAFIAGRNISDNILLAHEDKRNSIRYLKGLLDRYCNASGQVLNDEKCGILYSPSMKLSKIRTCIRVSKSKIIKELENIWECPWSSRELRKKSSRA